MLVNDIAYDDFEINHLQSMNDSNIKLLIKEIIATRDFIHAMDELTFGRVLVYIKGTGIVNGNRILESSSKTLESIKLCCENYNMADAFCLLRKYRDDLFFYLYLCAIEKKENIVESYERSNLTEEDQRVKDWINNQMGDLHIGDIMKYIASVPVVMEVIKKYHLK